jgi:hypothetical protein
MSWCLSWRSWCASALNMTQDCQQFEYHAQSLEKGKDAKNNCNKRRPNLPRIVWFFRPLKYPHCCWRKLRTNWYYTRCSLYLRQIQGADLYRANWKFPLNSKLGPLGTSATEWPILPAPGDYDDGEFGGMKIGRGNRNTRRKPATAPLCPPQIPLDQNRVWTRAAAVGSQRLTAWAMARPKIPLYSYQNFTASIFGVERMRRFEKK